MSARAVAVGSPAGETTAPTTRPLPQLREDLRLLDGGTDHAGARRWLIYDPLQHRFIAIDRPAFVMLDQWRAGATAAELAAAAWEHHGEHVDSPAVERFAHFLTSSGLTLEAAGGGWRGYHDVAEKRRSSVGSRVLHGYLFFRIPLVHPEPFLRATLNSMRWFGARAFGRVIGALGLAGLYLVSRQWDDFLSTFADVFSFHGAALLAVAMMLVKVLHELGHGYTAAHFGCRVPVIGVAIVLGVPMLYCDVTDAWRLQSRRERLLVDSAGIMVDLAVACVATFLWAFLPPGSAKALCFSLATAGWAISLTMNLNPFMKFDGYHIATDACGIENMQARAMVLARWRLREILFQPRVPVPDRLSRRTTALLVGYGWSIWLYRLITFTGIAVAVYAYFFKLAGVVLFLVEIGYFIAAPLGRELREWFRMRKSILSSWRTAVTASVLVAVIASLGVPWSSHTSVPAVLEVEGLTQLYPPVPARVRAVHVAPGQTVAAGALLVSLEAPALAQELELIDLKAATVQLRQSRRASDAQDRAASAVLDQEHGVLMRRRAGLAQQIRELDIRAPAAGVVVEMATALHAGRWITMKEPVAIVRTDRGLRIRGYLDGADVWRVKQGAAARFVPDDISLPVFDASVREVTQACANILEQIELVSSYGGRVADRLDSRHQPVPVTAQYPLRADVAGGIAPDVLEQVLRRTVTGVLIAEGEADSFLARSWRQALKVLVRESGV